MPLLVSVPIVPAFDPAAAPRRPRQPVALPPAIAPLLVSVVIVPEFDTPEPPAPPKTAAAAAGNLPLLVSDVIVPAFDMPATRAAATAHAPPLPPLIVPLLVRVVIVAPWPFDTPAPPAPPSPTPEPPFPP